LEPLCSGDEISPWANIGVDLAPYVYTKAIMALLINFNWEFANPVEEHEIESKFETRLKNVFMKWTPRV